MWPRAESDGLRQPAVVRPAYNRSHGQSGGFSLAEMMIALAVLAMGLLVIGAALPIGVRYTRESVNLATGAAAAEYALDVVTQSISLPRTIFDPTGVRVRDPGVFQPRFYQHGTDPDGQFVPNYEPLIKVRPLPVRGILAKPGMDPSECWLYTPAEWRVKYWFSEALGNCCDVRETDGSDSGPGGGSDGWMKPALASISAFYPPPSTPRYVPSMPPPPLNYNEPVSLVAARKAREQRTVWCAFYRRVSYACAGYDPNFPISDPCLYEFVVVVTRLPSEQHRFPVQDPGSRQYEASSADSDTAGPIPWMIEFDNLPPLPSYLENLTTGERFLDPSFAAAPQPATIAFGISATHKQWGSLLLPGSVLIPAVNDYIPTALNQVVPPITQVAGLVPSAPDVLPIYEVQERFLNADDSYTILVKNNGFYPWVSTEDPRPMRWPVWVVPPPFAELSHGEPQFPDRNPIVAVSRRTVRLREIP